MIVYFANATYKNLEGVVRVTRVSPTLLIGMFQVESPRINIPLIEEDIFELVGYKQLKLGGLL